MGFVNSNLATFFITDAGGTERDISQYVTEVFGLPDERQLVPITVLGDGGVRFIPVRPDVTPQVVGFYDDTATSGPDAIIGVLRTHTAETSFRFVLTTDIGTTTYSGSAWVTTFEHGVRVGSLVSWTMGLQIEDVTLRLFRGVFEFLVPSNVKGDPDDEQTVTLVVPSNIKGDPDDEDVITADVPGIALEV